VTSANGGGSEKQGVTVGAVQFATGPPLDWLGLLIMGISHFNQRKVASVVLQTEKASKAYLPHHPGTSVTV
jgi:hypothetical protein